MKRPNLIALILLSVIATILLGLLCINSIVYFDYPRDYYTTSTAVEIYNQGILATAEALAATAQTSP